MKHLFNKGANDHFPLLLLHGTGGNEYDLLPLAEKIDSEASVLSVRGSVMEQGMPRFFRRLAEGVFDEEDLLYRTAELNDFIAQAAKEHSFQAEELIAIGYSNGANIAGSLLFHHQDSLNGALLFHPMVPRRGVEIPDLSGVSIFISAGRQDPICRPEETLELEKLLKNAGADVTVFWTDGGHQLTAEELEEAAQWYRNTFKHKDDVK